jgi:LmbE family N-acetylglucosaminyl deacetylase
MKLFLSPHNDDAALFGSFTILRERPLVVTVLDSHKQCTNGGPTMVQRRREDEAAMIVLGGAPIMFWGASDASANWPDIEAQFRSFFGQPEMVYAPAYEAEGHADHNALGTLAGRVFKNVTYYMTYTRNGKSTGVPVNYEPGWAVKKLQALACYESQIRQRNQVEHFLREQGEYYRA